MLLASRWKPSWARVSSDKGGAPLNVLLTLAKMHGGLPLQAVRLVGEDGDGDYINGDTGSVRCESAACAAHAFGTDLDVAGDDRSLRLAYLFPLPAGANRLLDIDVFKQLNSEMKSFHLKWSEKLPDYLQVKVLPQ